MARDSFMKNPNVTDRSFCDFRPETNGQKNYGTYFHALSDLTRGCGFGEKKDSILRSFLCST